MRPLLRRSSSLISVRGRFLDGPDAGLEWLVVDAAIMAFGRSPTSCARMARFLCKEKHDVSQIAHTRTLEINSPRDPRLAPRLVVVHGGRSCRRRRRTAVCGSGSMMCRGV